MSFPTTGIGFSPTTPAAPAGYSNVVPQGDNGSPQEKFSFYAPSSGGAAAKTASYTAVIDDNGVLLSFNSATAVTLTLPATPPFAKWRIAVQNIGVGALTISPNSLTIDGATASLTLAQNAGCWIFSDGTNYFSERGSGSGGGGGSTTYYGNAYVNASSTFNQVNLGSTPISGTVSLYIDGAIVSPGSYTIGGSMISLSSSYFGSHVVVATWATTNSTPGSISVSAGGTLNPGVRGAGIQYATTSSITVLWPSGTIAGDLAVILLQTAYNITAPSGWTSNDLHNGAIVNGAVFSKILTSTDISNGSVTIALAGAYGATAAVATFVGNTAGIRETVVNNYASSTAGSHSILMTSTSGSVANTDTALYFGAHRGVSDSVTINRGTLQNTSSGAQSSGALYSETITTAGAVQPTVNYPSTDSGYYQCTVIVKGV